LRQLLTRVFGSRNERIVRGYGRYVRAANQLEHQIKPLTNEALRAKTDEFRGRLKEGATLDDLLPEAFAVVREAALRTLGMRHFDVQLIGGIALHKGMISGGTGAGKTTLLNLLSGFIPETERIVTIEDSAELQLQQPHVVRMETLPTNIEGKGEITQRALVRNALRMRPDRIIIGEVRGAEAVDMLQAMNTGHDGSLTTIHANNPRDALSRIENMIGMANLNLPHKAARQQIASAITVVVQVLRLIDGKRKVTSIQEITRLEGEVITMQEIFAFRQTGVGADGAVEGYFHATGVRPKFCERLRAFGIALPDAMFDAARHYH